MEVHQGRKTGVGALIGRFSDRGDTSKRPVKPGEGKVGKVFVNEEVEGKPETVTDADIFNFPRKLHVDRWAKFPGPIFLPFPPVFNEIFPLPAVTPPALRKI